MQKFLALLGKSILCCIILSIISPSFLASSRGIEDEHHVPCAESRVSACVQEHRNEIDALQIRWQAVNNAKNRAAEVQKERINELQELNVLLKGHAESEILLEKELNWLNRIQKDSSLEVSPLLSIKIALQKKNFGKNAEILEYLAPQEQQKIIFSLHANDTAYETQLKAAIIQITELLTPLKQVIRQKEEEIHSLTQPILARRSEEIQFETSIQQHANMCNSGCREQICPL